MSPCTYIGFFIVFNSSSVFQYRSHRYLGLLFPMSRWLRICGPFKTSLWRLSSALDISRSCSLPFIISIPISSSSSPALCAIEVRRAPARDTLDWDRSKVVKAPWPLVAIGLDASWLAWNPRVRGVCGVRGGSMGSMADILSVTRQTGRTFSQQRALPDHREIAVVTTMIGRSQDRKKSALRPRPRAIISLSAARSQLCK